MTRFLIARIVFIVSRLPMAALNIFTIIEGIDDIYDNVFTYHSENSMEIVNLIKRAIIIRFTSDERYIIGIICNKLLTKLLKKILTNFC